VKHTTSYILELRVSYDDGKTWQTPMPRMDLERLFTAEELPRVVIVEKDEHPWPGNGFRLGKALIASIEREVKP
jgi:hypothetical protein